MFGAEKMKKRSKGEGIGRVHEKKKFRPSPNLGRGREEKKKVGRIALTTNVNKMKKKERRTSLLL